MDRLERIIKVNDEFEFQLQKFIDVASNIKDEELRTRLIAQMIKCQKTLIDIMEKE